ncbi:unnamed protein product [Staurois parvus]|uniref:Uncharacterized protein n=1 Tax=Staurois parvus TaxID=386267 RepID=A0ABN9DLF5_9NEOB|nr:unnamed protein product [Staurois parvus]
MQGPGRAGIVNAGSRESGYTDTVNAGSGGERIQYSECGVRGERIQ